MSDGKELFICSECQAYFCPDCLRAVENYSSCPAARLLGVKEHELKCLKILPPKPLLPTAQMVPTLPEKKSSVKILPKKSVKVLEPKKLKKNLKK